MALFNRKPVVKARVVAILGMHRSGTSCMAGSLQEKGLYLDDVCEWNEHNRKGNRENQAIAELNEKVLKYSGGSWHEPPERIKWKRSHAKRRNDIVRQFESGNRPVWGFKDPRVCLTLKFWQDVIPHMEYVGTYRHPLLVALSLHKRDDMPLDYAMNVWSGYNERMLAEYRRNPFPIQSFNVASDEYLAGIDRITAKLQLPAPDGTPFLDTTLQSAAMDDANEQLSYAARKIYADLEAAYNDSMLAR
jgi:hypothetical protein